MPNQEQLARLKELEDALSQITGDTPEAFEAFNKLELILEGFKIALSLAKPPEAGELTPVEIAQSLGLEDFPCFGFFSLWHLHAVVHPDDIQLANAATEHAWAVFKQWLLTKEGLTAGAVMAFEAGQKDRQAEHTALQALLVEYQARVDAAEANMQNAANKAIAWQQERSATDTLPNPLLEAAAKFLRVNSAENWAELRSAVKTINPQLVR